MTCTCIRRIGTTAIAKERSKRNDIRKKLSLFLTIGVALIAVASVPLLVGAIEENSVSDYQINSVIQTNPNTIVVSVECTFCSACNPNDAGNPGCTPFSTACGFPPPSYPGQSGYPCAAGCPDGRFVAVELVGSFGIVMQKMVCTPSNWPIGGSHAQDFVFSGLSLEANETITVYADFYCSWCGHWWAAPQTFVPQLGIGYFIIVAGNHYGSLSEQINYGCNEVFKILRDVGYSGDSIYYMNQPEYSPQDVDGDGQNDIDNLSTSANLQWSIETWASDKVGPAQPLFLYLFDHGGFDVFCIDSPDQVNPTQLASWFDTLEGATNAPIHLIYAACHSGSFIDETSKSGRVITTSSRAIESSWVSPDGKWEAFSQPFWNQIKSGHSMAWSFNIACDVVDQQGYPQTPLLDDNDDSIGHTGPLPDGGDGYLAGDIYIGSCEWPFPWISYAIPKLYYTWPPPTTVTLWAEIENKTPLAHVRAWMQPPGWTPPPPDMVLSEMPLERFEMTDLDHDGNFTVDIPSINFTNHASGPSDFRFIITAEEENGNTATSVSTGVGFTLTGEPPVDVQSPIAHIERPLDGRFVQGTVSINGTVSDDMCLKRAEFYVGADLVGAVDLPPTSNSFFELDLDTTTVSNGLKTLQVRVFDASNNVGTHSYVVQIDNPYDVTIGAYCYTESKAVGSSIRKDWILTGLNTPHTFTDLRGVHTFTVPLTDSYGHPFKQWSTGETSTTIAVSLSGTYTAYYGTTPVGGTAFPVDKLDLLAPYIAVTSTIIVAKIATAIYVKRVKRRKEKQ